MSTDSEIREQAAQIAEKGRALINQHGWTQHWGGDEEHGFCFYGATSKAHLDLYLSDEPTYDRVGAWSKFERTARIVSGQDYLSIWNDASTTKKEDIMGLLRKVAAVLRV